MRIAVISRADRFGGGASKHAEELAGLLAVAAPGRRVHDDVARADAGDGLRSRERDADPVPLLDQDERNHDDEQLLDDSRHRAFPRRTADEA